MTDARSLDDLQQTTRRHWRQVALSTKPIDKARAARAVEAIYVAATGRPPAHVLFFESPLQAEIAGTFFTFNYPQPPSGRDQGRAQVARTVRQSVGMDTFGAPGRDASDVPQLENPTRAALDATYHAAPDRAVFARAFELLCGQLPPRVRSFCVVPAPRYQGWLWRVKRSAAWSVSLRSWIACATYHSFLQAAFPRRIPRQRLISAVIDVASECGWCWFFPDIAIVADRPASVQLDGSGRLHAEDGPALRYRDGFSIHALHGVRVARWMIERPGRITAADVENEPNAEVRRALVERMGHQRYLSLSGAEPIALDETGRLWRRNLPNRRGERRRAWCFVEVVNGTREPDGSHKCYFLRVPPTMRTAREAVAWTYGLTAEAYLPLMRT